MNKRTARFLKKAHKHIGECMDAMKGGQRLKSLRESKKLTQKQLAERAGIDRLVVVRIETGTTASLSLEAAILIGRVLGLDANEVARLYEI